MDEQTVRDLRNELREALLPWMLVPYALIGFAFSMYLLDNIRPPSFPALGVLFLSLVSIAATLRKSQPSLAMWLMHTGAILIFFLAWLWFPESYAYEAMIFPIVAASVTLGLCGGATLASLATVLFVLDLDIEQATIHFVGDGSRFVLILVSWGLVYLVFIAQRPERTLITWVWREFTQAQKHLEDARDRQVQLKQALEDLALATAETIRLNNMLAAARKAVENARKAKEEFVANVSHELRTPLNMIIGFSDMILESPQVYARRLPPALLADIAAIKRNSQHLATLVDDVLDLSEIEGGYIHLNKEWISLSEVIREAAQAVTALFQKKGLDLTLDIPDNLPLIYCDRTRIRQVILNLLSNAGRFTETGGCNVRVITEDETCTISISDTGPGMRPERLKHMFEPFQQGDPSIRRRYGGTGLGLAISKRFVELHGGKIWLESQVGVGTTVYFTLPMDKTIQEREDEQRSRWFKGYEERVTRTRRSLAPNVEPKPRVIVFEEGTALSRLARRHLDEIEVIRITAKDDLAQAVRQYLAAAVLINEATEGLPSRALVKSLRSAFDIPIISCWVPERKTAFIEMGAQDYLVKPIERMDLLESIQRAAPEAKTILLVDDDDESRQLFRRMLASAARSYNVLHAENGTSALTLLRERKPDIMLLDLVMPNVDGFEVLERKRADPVICNIPVIIISAKDPHREPLLAKSLRVIRPMGLSGQELMASIRVLTTVLKPRFGSSTLPETLGA